MSTETNENVKSVQTVVPKVITKKEVIIRVKNDNFRLAKEAPDVFQDSDLSFGSFFDGTTPVRPLSFYEEAEIMPKLVGIGSNSPDFETRVEEFFYSLTVKVPTKSGKILNTTLRGIKTIKVNIDGEEVPMEIPLPEQPLDYVMYRLALKHHRVAKSKLESEDAPNGVIFYIEDKQDEMKRKADQYLDNSKANKLWIKLASDEDRIKANAAQISHIFELTKDIHGESSRDKEIMEKVVILDEKVVKTDPKFFIEIAEDVNIELKVLIVNALEYSILTKVANTIYDNDQALGESLEEVVLYMNNPKNSDFTGKLTARLEHAKKTTRK